MAAIDQVNAPMTIAVEFQIRPENGSMQQWLDVWNARAEDAYAAEPETHSYASAVNLDEPNNVLVFERYGKGKGSLDEHLKRPAHTNLIETMGRRNMTKRQLMGAFFNDIPGFGFWSRPGTTPSTKSRFTLLGLRFAKPQMQQRWIEMVGEHAAYCRDNELPTLIYSAGIANADSKREIEVQAGDVIVAMLSADEQGIAVHQNDERHLALQAAFANEGMERDLLFARRYQVSGNGYWWR